MRTRFFATLLVAAAAIGGLSLRSLGQFKPPCVVHHAPKACQDCAPAPDDCTCVSGSCVTDQVVCVFDPVAANQSLLPCSWKNQKEVRNCSFRNGCVNTLGEDGGRCTGSTQCDSDPGTPVATGSLRNVYVKQIRCDPINCIE